MVNLDQMSIFRCFSLWLVIKNYVDDDYHGTVDYDTLVEWKCRCSEVLSLVSAGAASSSRSSILSLLRSPDQKAKLSAHRNPGQLQANVFSLQSHVCGLSEKLTF